MPDLEQQTSVPNFEDKFPDKDNSTEIIISKAPDGTLERKKRSLHTAIDNFTVEGLRNSIKTIEDKIAILEGQKAYFLRLNEWAEANEICPNNEAFQKMQKINSLEKAIKETEEIEEKSPEDFARLKQLKKQLKDVS